MTRWPGPFAHIITIPSVFFFHYINSNSLASRGVTQVKSAGGTGQLGIAFPIDFTALHLADMMVEILML